MFTKHICIYTTIYIYIVVSSYNVSIYNYNYIYIYIYKLIICILFVNIVDNYINIMQCIYLKYM